MATQTVAAPRSKLASRGAEHLFFFLYVLLIAGIVFVGFARSYFLAGLVRAPLPDRLTHIHGAVFSSWIVLLLVQSGLVLAGKLQWHRTLGILGFGIAGAMVVLGPLAARDMLAHQRTPGHAPPLAFFFAAAGLVLFVFAPMIGLALACRRSRPQAHKRLIVLATLAIAEAGLQRWPIAAISETAMGLRLVMGGMVLLLAAYDLASRKKLQPVTIWAGLYVMVMREALFPLGMTHAWTAVCLWARGHGILAF